MTGKTVKAALIDEKFEWLKEKLKTNPTLTRSHFHKCGYSYPYLNKLAQEGVVTFGTAKSKTGGWR